jgi:hypothetical protein
MMCLVLALELVKLSLFAFVDKVENTTAKKSLHLIYGNNKHSFIFEGLQRLTFGSI